MNLYETKMALYPVCGYVYILLMTHSAHLMGSLVCVLFVTLCSWFLYLSVTLLFYIIIFIMKYREAILLQLSLVVLCRESRKVSVDGKTRRN